MGSVKGVTWDVQASDGDTSTRGAWLERESDGIAWFNALASELSIESERDHGR